MWGLPPRLSAERSEATGAQARSWPRTSCYPLEYTGAFPQPYLSPLLRSRTRKDQLMASPAVDFARNNQQRFLSELKDLLRIRIFRLGFERDQGFPDTIQPKQALQMICRVEL